MDKDMLRDKLFQSYFQIEDGILVSDLVDKLSFIPNVWSKLHLLCCKNVKHFDSFSQLEKCMMIEHLQKKYLIIKLRMWKYIIIDLDKMDNIDELEFMNNFDELFFVNNFNEIKEDEDMFPFMYHVVKYEGNIDELFNFYIDNQNIFNLSSKIHYKTSDGNVWTWFHIDFVNAGIQMGFQTTNQFLYEQLFLNYDLTPYGMQDAQEKMGIDKMNEIFDKIKDIRITRECIPDDLYYQYLNLCYTKDNKRVLR